MTGIVTPKLDPTEKELEILAKETGFDRLQVLGLVSVIDRILAARAKAAADREEHERLEASGAYVG